MKTSKETFVKALMNALRLDYNEFTAERNSEFEKPIQNIAKGVQEFCDIKFKPKEDYAKKMSNEIKTIFLNMRDYYSDKNLFQEFLLFKKDNKFFKTLIKKDSSELIFNDEILDIIFEVGLYNIAEQINFTFTDKEVTGDFILFQINYEDVYVYKYLTRDRTRSISDRIEIQADKKQVLSLESLKRISEQKAIGDLK